MQCWLMSMMGMSMAGKLSLCFLQRLAFFRYSEQPVCSRWMTIFKLDTNLKALNRLDALLFYPDNFKEFLAPGYRDRDGNKVEGEL